MKKLTKLLTLALTLALVLAMATPAMATGDDGGASTGYTITAPSNGHTYEVYQIFTGDLSGGVLSNVKWGQNGTGTTDASVDSTVMNALTAVNNKSDLEKLAVIEQYVNLKSDEFDTVVNGNPLKNVPAGYYLIKDINGKFNGENDSYTLYIVEVVDDVTVEPKSAVPTFEKKVKDINDSTDTSESGWQDSADHDIGDQVKFQLKGTVASNYTSYKGKYYFAFHDQQSAGLTFDSTSVVVTVGETTITSGYNVITTGLNDGCTFEVNFNDLKTIKDANNEPIVTNGSVITVEYTATLNENAAIGSKGNPNQAKLEFSNNPNAVQQGDTKPETGKTPWDKVIVFTYKTVINKVDGKSAPLTGAAFKLEKQLQNGDWITVKEFTVDETTTTFEFVGLDDGNYKLSESVTPGGYNPIDPIEFTVTAEHVTLDPNPSLTSLSGNVTTGQITFTPNVTAGSLSTNVVNQSGTTLPETGGIGTTIFYILGSVLALGAVVLLVTKKRMASEG